MNEVIKTKSIGKNFAIVEKDVVLSEKPTSRIIFKPQIHDKGIRGNIIKQRREDDDDEWITDKSVPIRKLEKGEGVQLELNTSAILKLYKTIRQLGNIIKTRGIQYGGNEYTIVDPNNVVITKNNKTHYIKKLLNEGYGKAFWQELTEKNPSLAEKLSYAKIQVQRQKVIDELQGRLEKNVFKKPVEIAIGSHGHTSIIGYLGLTTKNLLRKLKLIYQVQCQITYFQQ